MGYVTNCDDMVSCTKIAVGPCEGSETTSPSAYLTAEFVGTVFVDHDKYLKDPTTQMKMINFAGPGYRDTKSGISDTGGGGECNIELAALFLPLSLSFTSTHPTTLPHTHISTHFSLGYHHLLPMPLYYNTNRVRIYDGR